jgi:hypothetical protein
LENHDLPRRPALRRDHGALRARRADQWRAGSGADTEARRHCRDGHLGSHKGAAINEAIRARGARRFFLPQYSPDLNPIEQVFAKLKKLLRKAEQRTPEGVWKTIGSLLDLFPADECAAYLRNSGYAST